MFFSVFYAIRPSGTTCNLSEKGGIEKMAYLAEFWIILESDLVECVPPKMFIELI